MLQNITSFNINIDEIQYSSKNGAYDTTRLAIPKLTIYYIVYIYCIIIFKFVRMCVRYWETPYEPQRPIYAS